MDEPIRSSLPFRTAQQASHHSYTKVQLDFRLTVSCSGTLCHQSAFLSRHAAGEPALGGALRRGVSFAGFAMVPGAQEKWSDEASRRLSILSFLPQPGVLLKPSLRSCTRRAARLPGLAGSTVRTRNDTCHAIGRDCPDPRLRPLLNACPVRTTL